MDAPYNQSQLFVDMKTSSNQVTPLQSYLRPGEVIVVCVDGGPWEGSCGFNSALLPLPATSLLSGKKKTRRKICLRATEAHSKGGGIVDCVGNSRAVGGKVCSKLLNAQKYTVRRKIGYTEGASGIRPVYPLLRPCSTLPTRSALTTP